MQRMVALLAACTVILVAMSVRGDEDPPRNPGSALGDYLNEATLSWMKLPDCEKNPHACEAFVKQESETVAQVAARIRETSEQVALLVRGPEGSAHPDEDPVFVDGRADGVARSGLLLMSVAFNETRFRGYVDDGRCNSLKWRMSAEGHHLSRLGTCDSGKAVSVWQLQLKGSLGSDNPAWILFTHEEWTSDKRDNAVKVDADGAIKDRGLAALLALHELRKSVRATGTIRYYTGEWQGPTPLSDARMKLASDYANKHPFKN